MPPRSSSFWARYGLTQACLAGAALFFIVAMIAAGTYMVRKRQNEARARERAKERAKEARSALHNLSDPTLSQRASR